MFSMRLSGEKLSLQRGGRLVFKDVDFTVGEGELLVLTGANGAGKTSLLRLIAGFLEPQSGMLRLDRGDRHLDIGQQSHFCGHEEAIKRALTVRENLKFWAGFLGAPNVDEALASFGLDGLQQFPAAVLSAGQRRRLALSRLKLAYRPIWLLDEPAVGLDGKSVEVLTMHMEDHLQSGGVIVAATHMAFGPGAASTLNLGEAA